MLNATEKKGLDNFRLLKSFQDNNIIVHFKFDSGPEEGSFCNGKIIDLSEEKRTLVLDERLKGMQPYLLEYIKTDSIKPFKEKL